ncbi:MAG: recombinase family protein [Verrucomicrobia bacterium]|nr:recombinase family protein [Verrucomicrobiota bacterium]
MLSEAHQKVTASHLRRDAYLYVRQSTPRQVLENTESTQRQYDLRQRAVALGWPLERVVVIDHDLGHSAATASAADRQGFQKLVSEVSLGRAGIVLGLEVSRLARNSSDWHRLVEICGLTDTLILDEDGIYDPGHFNDRLLLGLKGTMSEAELHVLHARMRGGLLHKAKRGELAIALPIGFIYRDTGEVVLDPNEQVRESIRLLFATFRRTGSVSATVREFHAQGLNFPGRPVCGPRKEQLVWGPLELSRARYVLRNPRYAGAYVYGQHRCRKKVDGTGYRNQAVPAEQWHAFLKDAHPSYITWEEHEDILRRLAENSQAHGDSEDRQQGPAREGPALLQGLVLCGRCGRRMTIRYHSDRQRIAPAYICGGESRQGGPLCQNVPGTRVDQAIGALLVEAMSPAALELALSVQQEIQDRLGDADRLRKIQVERAQYEAHLSQRRYMRVDPDNRLVADALEADWNQKLRALAEAQQEYDRQRKADELRIDSEKRSQILSLASDFPRLWNDPNTPDRERKRMARLILEDVTLLRGEQITVQVRFKGGATRTLQVSPFDLRSTDPEVVAEIDRLLNHHTRAEIAAILNERGLQPTDGTRFTTKRVSMIERYHHLKSRYQRLREAGLRTRREVAQMLAVSEKAVARLRADGRLRGRACDGRGHYLYQAPASSSLKPPQHAARNNVKYEVQYEA